MKEKIEIRKILDKFSSKYNLQELFNDLLTFQAGYICLYNEDPHLLDEVDRITEKYSEKEIKKFLKLFELFDQVVQKEPMEDFIGDLYYNINILNGDLSLKNLFPRTIKQYQSEDKFSKKDLNNYFKKKGFIDLFDTTYSHGRKSIAALESVIKLGFDKKDIFVLIHEKNNIEAYLTYINVSLRDYSAIVKEIDPDTEEEKQMLFSPVFCRNQELVDKIDAAALKIINEKEQEKTYE